MSENITKIIERLEYYIDLKGYKFNQLATAIGVSNSYFSKMIKSKGSLGEDIIKKILLFYDDINPIWLLLGSGNMLKSDTNADISSKPKEKTENNIPNPSHKSRIYTHSNLSANISEPFQQYISNNIISIPIVDVSAAAGHGFFNPDHPETLGELSFPVNLLQKKHGNYYCGRVNGESMAPTLLNQDFIIFRLLSFEEWMYVEDDNIYFIVDRSGASCVKRIKNRLKEEHGILCTSDSFDKASFRDFMIPGEEIANIYHVEWRFSKDMTNINQTYFNRVEILEEQMKNVQETIQNRLS